MEMSAMKTNSLQIAMLACLGLASSVNAACPPEECSGQREVIEVARLVEGAPLDEAGVIFEVRPMLTEVRGSPVGGQMKLMAVQSAGQPEKTRVRVKNIDKDSGSYVVANDGETISLKIENGKVVSLDRNGKKIPADRVAKSGNTIKILGEDGKVMHEFDLGEGGDRGPGEQRVVVRGQALPGGMMEVPMTVQGFAIGEQAEPPKAMIGVQLGEADGMLLGHFGLEPGEVTLITGVYEDLPGGEAGLKPYDIIVAVNGEKPAGQTELREALRGLDAGTKVTLTVIHRGEKRDVTVKLVEYNAEALEQSKLDAVAPEAMGFAFGPGGQDNVFVAPGLGQLRNMQGQDAEKWREFADAWREQADKFAQRYNEAGPQGRVLELEGQLRELPVPPTPRMAPGAPGAGRTGSGMGTSTDDRWQRMEERLERLEKLIERLAEQRSGGGR
jgi:membrane-associated protease RseP (regulator of RpoE activity)